MSETSGMDGLEPLALRVDHVVIEADDADSVFAFLIGALGLPVAWPIARWGMFHEGGVSFGNCNIGCNQALEPGTAARPRVSAIALEPACDVPALVEAMRGRGLEPTEPISSGIIDVPDVEPFAPWQRGWTTVVDFSARFAVVPFFCAYDHDVGERVRRQRFAFEASGGGPLGITDLRAVVISTDRPRETIEAWTLLLGPEVTRQSGVLALPNGPELRFRQGTSPPGLVLGVRSLDQAIDGARSIGLACERGDGVRLDPSDLMGLEVQLE